MSSLIRVHPSVSGLRAAAHHASSLFAGRGTATLLLAAVVAALLVVANQVIDSWTEGHLLVAWIAMWAVAFAALALLAAPLRRLVATWRRAAEDGHSWRLARTDSRLMAELGQAMTRDALRDVRGYY